MQMMLPQQSQQFKAVWTQENGSTSFTLQLTLDGGIASERLAVTVCNRRMVVKSHLTVAMHVPHWSGHGTQRQGLHGQHQHPCLCVLCRVFETD